MRISLTTSLIFSFTGLLYTSQAQKYSNNNFLNTPITINEANCSLRKVFNTIEHYYNVTFSYSNEIIDDKELTNINFDGSICDILDLVLPNNISYRFIGSSVILFPTPDKLKPVEKKQSSNVSASIKTIQPIVIKENIEKLKSINNTSNLLNTSSNIISNRLHLNNNLPPLTSTDKTPKKRNLEYEISLFYQYLSPKIIYSQQYGTYGYSVIKESNIYSDKKGALFCLKWNNLHLGSGISSLSIKESYTYPVQNPLALTDTQQTTNKYEYVSVPLLIGYSQYIYSKLSFQLNCIFWITELFETNSTFFDVNSSSFNDENFINSYYNEITTSIEFCPSINYLLFPKISACLSPSYSIQLNSEYTNYYPVTKKRNLMGIKFEIKYKF